MLLGYLGVIFSIIVVFVTLALEEVMENDSQCAKTVDLTNGIKHITIPSFDEWCKQNSDVSIEHEISTETNEIIVIKPTETDSTTYSVSTATNVTTIPETDILSALVVSGVTKARANILFEYFGSDLLTIAKEGGAKALTKIKGIGDATAVKVVALANQLIPD